jgi:hypothetical protein
VITDIKVNLKDIQNQSSTLSSNVKKFCGSSSHRIHPKGRDAFHTPVFWRISESVNDIWPHILALPDLSDPTVADKVLLLHFDGEPSERRAQEQDARSATIPVRHSSAGCAG